MSETKPGISRRTLVKGTAWAVPAVAVASAAPAMAQSLPPIVIDWGNTGACKIPGDSFRKLCYDKGYVLWGVFKNTSTLSASVTITGITVGGIAQCLVGIADYTVSCNTALTSNTFTVAPGATAYIAIYSNASSDSSSTSVEVSFNYTLTGQPQASSTQSGYVTGNPWQGSCVFPSNAQCSKSTSPLSACGTPCAAGATTTTSTTVAPTTTTTTEEVTTTTTTEPEVTTTTTTID